MTMYRTSHITPSNTFSGSPTQLQCQSWLRLHNCFSQDQLVQILRVVVFAGPGSLVLHYVLQALLAATKYPDITDNLCHNAGKFHLCKSSGNELVVVGKQDRLKTFQNTIIKGLQRKFMLNQSIFLLLNQYELVTWLV